MPPAERTLIFLHLPKTAGTTLYRLLERQFPAGSMYFVNPRGAEYDALLAMPAGQKAKLRLIHGHMGFGLHHHLPPGATYFTLLRDPVARVISTYHYIRRTPQHTHHQAVAGDGQSLREFVLSQVSPVSIDNGQLRLLCGAADAGNEIPFGGCTRALLDQAKANLREHFSVVGLTEAFDATLILLRRTFGWRVPVYKRENVTQLNAGEITVDPETRALIAAHNTYDSELHTFAGELFQQQLLRQGPAMRFELHAFRLLNAAYQSPLRNLKHRLTK